MSKKIVSLLLSLFMVLSCFYVCASEMQETTLIDMVDFESLTEQSTSTEIEAATGLVPVSSNQKTVIKEVSGNKVLSVSTAGSGQYGHVEVNLGEQLKRGTFSISYKIKTNGDTFSDWSAFQTILLTSPVGGGVPTMLTLQGGKWNSFGSTVSPVQDSDGWYNIRVNMSRLDETSDWIVEVYSVLNEEETLLSTGNASKTSFPYIEEFWLARITAISSTAHTVYIDDIKAAKYQGKFKFSKVSVSEGNISPTLGEIDLIFNKEVDESSLSAVTFTHSDGTELSGFTSIKAEENIVKVIFGKLEEGSYILKINETLASNGELLGENFQFEYTATDVPDCYVDYTSEDFAPGVYDSNQLNSLNSDMVYINGGVYTIDEYNGTKVLKIQSPSVFSSSAVGYQFQEPFKSGIMSMTAEFKSSSDILVRNIFSFMTSDNKELLTLMIDREDDGIEISGNQSLAIPGRLSSQPQKDINGFYNVRFVVSRKSEDMDWDLALYDERTESEIPIYTATINKEKMSGFKRLFLASLYTMSAEECLQSLMVKNIAVSIENFPCVVDSNAEGISPLADDVSLKIAEEVDADDLDIKITKKDDETAVIKSEYIYRKEAFAIDITLKSFLEYGTEYIVSFGDSDLQPFTFKTEEADIRLTNEQISYKIANGATVQSIPQGIFSAIYEVDFSSNGGEQDICVILAAFDSEDRITKIKKEVINFETATASKTIELEGLDGNEVKKVYGHVWKDEASVYGIISK